MGQGRVPGTLNPEALSVDLDDGTLARASTPPPGPVPSAKGGHSKDGPTESLGDRVISYARQRLGQRVGDGQCFALVDNALRGAGARSAADYGEVSADADYVWGSSVALAGLQAGDLVQFRDYDYTVTRVTTTDTAVDTEEEGGDRPHHSAIVETVHGDGTVTVLEQNAPDGSPVTRTRLYFRSGTRQEGNTAITITVNGTFRFYRPQPRD